MALPTKFFFHCLGDEAQKRYGSHLDFTPHPSECIGVDHKGHTIILEVHAAVIFENDSQLRDYMMHEHLLICRMKRKRTIDNVDYVEGGIAMPIEEW